MLFFFFFFPTHSSVLLQAEEPWCQPVESRCSGNPRTPAAAAAALCTAAAARLPRRGTDPSLSAAEPSCRKLHEEVSDLPAPPLGGEPSTSHAPAGDAVPGSGGALAAVTCGAQRGAVAASPPRLSVARGSGSGCRRRRGGLGRGPRPGVSLSFPPPPPPRRRFP